MLALTLLLAGVVGLTLGLLGGGGSILMVPLLVYVAGMPTAQAITASLVVVGITSAVGFAGHARGRRVHWRTGALFGAAGMVGAFAGALVGARLPGQVLLPAFALLMVATAAGMLRGRPASSPRAVPDRPALARVLGVGGAVGLVTGVLGAGGGFLIVPALVLLAGLPIAAAVGTSLLVITMNTAAGLAGHLSGVPIDWPLTAAITVAAVAGSLLGARLTARIRPETLRRGFGWFVLAMGVVVLVEQAPPHLRVPALLVAAVVGVGMGTCSAFVAGCPLRHAGSGPAPA